MYRVLIADDEPVIREGLQVLVDWAALGFTVAGAVADGAAAVQWMRENTAELLVTDVRMPRMTGIELLQTLRGEQPDLKVIAVSGYDEFEYVRAMAALGIENYLLKPINEEELANTLRSTAEKLDRATQARHAPYQDDSLLRQNIINRWLYGNIGENELAERAKFLGLDLDEGPYRPAILRFARLAQPPPADTCAAIFATCAAILGDGKAAWCTQNYDGETLILATGALQGDDTLLPLLGECVAAVKRQHGTNLLAAAGQPVQGHWQVAGSFREMRRQASYLDLRKYAGAAEPEAGDEASPFSVRLAEYVLGHYSEELSLKQVAQHFRGNAAYIGQIFRRDMGRSFNEYLKMVRIEKACALLRETTLTTGDIAARVGFSSPNYFFTIFKKETGISPNEYRRTHQ